MTARAMAARTLTVMAGAGVAAHAVPSVATIPALRNRVLPRLSGISSASHVALTFDDGPDPASTPAFLEVLNGLGVHATFFLLGTQVDACPQLARRIVTEGHEVAVHGWRHRSHLLRSPWAVAADLARAHTVIEEATGVQPRFWRPPNGVLSGAGIYAAHRLGLQPVLWTVDGLDWQPQATPQSVMTRLAGQLKPGGTILLHDSDITSAPGCWRSALAALPALTGHCTDRSLTLGPLREHWPA